jgi:TIR domain
VCTWDFFISYTQVDRLWAEWVAWHLEAAGHTVLVQAWDFVPGSNWRTEMQRGVTESCRTIALVSPAYLRSVYGAQEWQAAWDADPQGFARKLVPIRIADCDRPGLLGGIVSIDLFGLEDEAASRHLLEQIDAVITGRFKPVRRPVLPASAQRGGSDQSDRHGDAGHRGGVGERWDGTQWHGVVPQSDRTAVVERPTVLRPLRVALLTGVPFGLVMFLVFGRMMVVSGRYDDLWILARDTLAGGALFGATSAAFVYLLHRQFFVQAPVLQGERLLKQGPAFHGLGIVGGGGWLYLTDGRLWFRSHWFNLHRHELSIPLIEIVDVRPRALIPDGLEIRTRAGAERYRVPDRRGWLREIARARGHGT